MALTSMPSAAVSVMFFRPSGSPWRSLASAAETFVARTTGAPREFCHCALLVDTAYIASCRKGVDKRVSASARRLRQRGATNGSYPGAILRRGGAPDKGRNMAGVNEGDRIRALRAAITGNVGPARPRAAAPPVVAPRTASRPIWPACRWVQLTAVEGIGVCVLPVSAACFEDCSVIQFPGLQFAQNHGSTSQLEAALERMVCFFKHERNKVYDYSPYWTAGTSLLYHQMCKQHSTKPPTAYFCSDFVARLLLALLECDCCGKKGCECAPILDGELKRLDPKGLTPNKLFLQLRAHCDGNTADGETHVYDRPRPPWSIGRVGAASV